MPAKTASAYWKAFVRAAHERATHAAVFPRPEYFIRRQGGIVRSGDQIFRGQMTRFERSVNFELFANWLGDCTRDVP